MEAHEVKISVLMSTFNEPVEWIMQSVQSILDQTFRDFEFIIINDNPSREDLKLFLQDIEKRDARICVSENENNQGLIKSLNKGIELAKGEYLARMDADDISHTDRFKLQLEYLDLHPEVGVCGTFAETFGDKSKLLKYPCDDLLLKLRAIEKSPFIHPSVMMRASLFSAGLRYDENDIHAEDYGLWVNLIKVTRFHNIEKVLLKYRTSGTQVSHKNLAQKMKAKEIRRRAVGLLYGERVNEILCSTSEIDLITINEVKNIIKNNDENRSNLRLINTLYLSITKMSVLVVMVYLIREKINQKTLLKLIKRTWANPKFNWRL
jgi:glycosyltransferase involved in cell wall biosynthesis